MATNSPTLGWNDFFLVNNNAIQVAPGSGIDEVRRNIIKSDSIHGYGGNPNEQKHFELNYAEGQISYSATLSGNIFRNNSSSADAFLDILEHTIDPVKRRQNITLAHSP